MNQEKPQGIEHGQPARLFPKLANQETGLTSVFLALLSHVPALAKDLLKTVGVNVGKRAQIECWTEVVPCNDGKGKQSSSGTRRPDGLIVVRSGKTTWTALVEAKIKNNELETGQIEHYLEIARDRKFDAVITISNQFVAQPSQSPIEVSDLPKSLLNKVDLFHWSWTYIRTECEMVGRDHVEDPVQKFILCEFLRYLEDSKNSGVLRFTQMNVNWRDLVTNLMNRVELDKKNEDIKDCIGCWFQEERDLSLKLTRHIGVKVQTVIRKQFADDFSKRTDAAIVQLLTDKTLSASFRIPDCASDLEVCVDLMASNLTCSMKLAAPKHRQTTSPRVKWLLNQLKDVDDSRLVIRAHWPGTIKPTEANIAELRENPSAIQTEKNHKMAPHRFEVRLINDLKKDQFKSRYRIIEHLEKDAMHFYEIVGQKLKAWQPPAPKPVKSLESGEHESEGSTD